MAREFTMTKKGFKAIRFTEENGNFTFNPYGVEVALADKAAALTAYKAYLADGWTVKPVNKPEPEKVAAPKEPEAKPAKKTTKKAEPKAPKAKAAKKNAAWFTRERYEAIADEKGWRVCVGSDRAGRPRMVITHRDEIYKIMKTEAGINC